MAYRTQTVALAPSLRIMLRKALLLGLLLASVALIYAEKKQVDWLQQARMTALSVTLPVTEVLASPMRFIDGLSSQWTHLWQVFYINRQLRYENEQLLQWREAALKLESENAALRQLMHYQPDSVIRYITAKIVGTAGSALSQRMSINVGLADGLRRHMAVVNGQGFIGRTVAVSEHHAQLLLITDVSSRIPVVLQPSGLQALLIGDHLNLPYLKLADPKQRPALGEVVMTSDDGDVLPEGLRIGALFAQHDGRYEVRPDFMNQPLGYVRVVDRTRQAAAQAPRGVLAAPDAPNAR